MKSQADIQRAHDLLVGLLVPETPVQLPRQLKLIVQFNADVLCWVLEHDHNDTFRKNMALLETLLAGRGIVLEDKGN